MILAIVSFGFVFGNSAFAEDENSAMPVNHIIEISTLSEIGTKKALLISSNAFNAERGDIIEFVLTQNITIDSNYVPSTDPFVDKFNGDGNTIILQPNIDVDFTGLFGSIENAELYNFSILGQNVEGNNYIKAVGQNMDAGILANTIKSSKVYGVKFGNLNILTNADDNAETNFGIVAGKVVASDIHQIFIDNCNIKNDAEDSITTNINVGFVAGKAIDGSKIQNCLVQNNTINLEIDDTNSSSFNFGGLVGIMENGFVTNNIINYANTQSSPISITTATNSKPLNIGYLFGSVAGNQVAIINNFVDATLIPNIEEEILHFGVVAGNTNYEIQPLDFEGFITTSNHALIYLKNNQQLVSTYSKIIYNFDQSLTANYFLRSESWNHIYSWDFNKIWKSSSLSVPELQYFMSFSIKFSSEESVKKSPIGKNLPPLDIIEAKINDEDYNQEEEHQVSYGDKVKFSINIKSNFSQYFKITAIYLNDEKVYDIKTFSNIGDLNINCTKENDAEIVFIIPNTTSKGAGTYRVELERITYKLKIVVLNYELTEEDTLIPGRVISSNAVTASEQLDVDMQYGAEYSYQTTEVNSDFAKEADWYVATYKTDEYSENNPLNSYNISEAGLQPYFVGRSNVEWIFNENGVLYNNKHSNANATPVEIDSYTFDNPDTEENESTEFVMFVVFKKDVKTVQIKFELNGDDITEQIAEVSIDGGSVPVYWNQEGYYTATIRFSSAEHYIEITRLNEGYYFNVWQDGTKNLPSKNKIDYSGTFKIEKTEDDENGDDGVYYLTCILTKEEVKQGASLLWLWILLGVVGLVAIIVIIVVIKKKRGGGGGGADYRKYMY